MADLIVGSKFRCRAEIGIFWSRVCKWRSYRDVLASRSCRASFRIVIRETRARKKTEKEAQSAASNSISSPYHLSQSSSAPLQPSSVSSASSPPLRPLRSPPPPPPVSLDDPEVSRAAGRILRLRLLRRFAIEFRRSLILIISPVPCRDVEKRRRSRGLQKRRRGSEFRFLILLIRYTAIQKSIQHHNFTIPNFLWASNFIASTTIIEYRDEHHDAAGIPVAAAKFLCVLGYPCSGIVYNTKSLEDKNFWATPLYMTLRDFTEYIVNSFNIIT